MVIQQPGLFRPSVGAIPLKIIIMEYQEVISTIKGKSGLYDIATPQGMERRRLFLSQNNLICEFAPRSRKRGYPIEGSIIADWKGISPHIREEGDIVAKFKRYAARATFPSAFIRKCLAADTSKSCYENDLTTGTRIDGEIISLKAIERFASYQVKLFREALKGRKAYHSGRFDFRGYDGSLWVEIATHNDGYYTIGDVKAGFSKEYRGCGNGYYYVLIDDEHFIGIDID